MKNRSYVMKRKHRSSLAVVAAMGLPVLGGGLAAHGQTLPPVTSMATASFVQESEARTEQSKRTKFHAWSECAGAAIVNPNDDELGTLDDVIVDRGSGAIRYAVIESGATLGIGGRRVVVPFHAIRWGMNTDNERVGTIDLTSEQIKSMQEFGESNWSVLESDDWANDMASWFGMGEPEKDERAPYGDSLKDAERTNITGEIVDVTRKDDQFASEHLIVTIRTEDGQERRIDFGPTWYVNGQEHAPFRSMKKVNVQAWQPSGMNDRAWLVAEHAEFHGEQITYRSQRGEPRWVLDQDRSASERDRGIRHRYLLASQLAGQNAYARDGEVGEVEDVVVAMPANKIAFFVVDIEVDLADLDDEDQRIVPWQIAAVTHEAGLRFDASKKMFESGSHVPDAWYDLSNSKYRDGIYRAYNIEPQEFSANDRHTAKDDRRYRTNNPRYAWTRDGQIAEKMQDAKSQTINGTFVASRPADLPAPLGESYELVMKTSEGKAKVIVLGPKWYFERQQMRCDAGDFVKADVKAVEIDGTTYYVAHSVEAGEADHRIWSDDGVPVWDGR